MPIPQITASKLIRKNCLKKFLNPGRIHKEAHFKFNLKKTYINFLSKVVF